MKWAWWSALIILLCLTASGCAGDSAAPAAAESTPKAAAATATPAPTSGPTPEATEVAAGPAASHGPTPAMQTPTSDASSLPPSAPVQTESGLVYIDVEVGTGAVAEPGTVVTVHYTGMLTIDNSVFDSSVEREEPFQFVLGEGAVIQGWEEGVAGMKVGGRRSLIIPPELAYGEQGFGDVIPPSSWLTFDVELLDVSR